MKPFTTTESQPRDRIVRSVTCPVCGVEAPARCELTNRVHKRELHTARCEVAAPLLEAHAAEIARRIAFNDARHQAEAAVYKAKREALRMEIAAALKVGDYVTAKARKAELKSMGSPQYEPICAETAKRTAARKRTEQNRKAREAAAIEEDLATFPQAVVETPEQRRVNDQLRSRGSVVQVDTGNIEYRLREARWRERSDRHRRSP